MHLFQILLALLGGAATDTTVLLFPPEGGAGELAWVGEGVAMSIAKQLRVPGIRVFTRDERRDFVEGADLPPNIPLSRASMIRVAQLASADRLITGAWSGSEKNVRLAFRVLDVKSMRLGGELVANGPLSALPELENELAWIILNDGGLSGSLSRRDFKARQRSSPNDAWASFILALDEPDEEEQIALMTKALELHQDMPEAAYRVGRYHFQRGEWALAVKHLKVALSREDQYLDTLFMLGVCQLRQDALTDAIGSYSKMLAFTRTPEALNNLAVAYIRRGEYVLGAQNLVEAHELSKGDVTVALNLAVVRHLEGNHAAALEILDRAAKTNPHWGVVQYLRSRVLEAQGQTEAAKAALAEAEQSGVSMEKLRAEGPRSWTRVHASWEARP
jgi:tetratricopeptide (TPR) repeat protein